MAKKALLALLGISLLIEIVFTSAGFIAPDWTLGQFQIVPSADTRFLGFTMAWMLFFVTLVIALAFWLVRRGDRAGWALSYVLGLWWVGIGIGIFAFSGRPDNLALDSAKGALIVVAAWLSRSQAARA
jgi:hypothetical protein